MNSKKIPLFCFLLTAALFMTGISYALWSETLYVRGTVEMGYIDWGFALPYNVLDEEGDLDWMADCSWNWWLETKDVGGPTLVVFVDTDGDGDYDKLEITLQNTYPYYAEEISFYLKCGGTVPIIFDRVVIDGVAYRVGPSFTHFLDCTGDQVPDIKIRYGDHIGTQFHPGDDGEVSISIMVLQEAPENAALSFELELVAVQYNEYVPP